MQRERLSFSIIVDGETLKAEQASSDAPRSQPFSACYMYAFRYQLTRQQLLRALCFVLL